MIKSRLYIFFVDPKYRIWRHILFILSFATISYRQITYIFQDSIATITDYIPFLVSITLMVYLSTLYANIYYLVPRFLLGQRYRIYLAGFFFIIFIQIAYLIGMEHIVRTLFEMPYKITSYTPLVFIQLIPTSTINMMCILGISATVLFKHQILENERMKKIEEEYIQSQLNRLKEQISPTFLSNILNRTSELTKTDSNKASDMLIRLGQLLRYQLYDCNRDRVLLSAEINFIKNYLDLEQIYCNQFEYEFTFDNNIKELLLPPLLLIPFIQNAANRTESIDKHLCLRLSLKRIENSLFFSCQSTNKALLSEVQLFAVKKRLNLMYPGNYILSMVEGKTELQLNCIIE